MTEAEVTGRSAFQRLFTEQTSDLMVELPDADEPMPLTEALSLLQDVDRERRAAAAGGGDGLARARPAHARLHLQHAAPGQVDQGPPALLRALARVAEPRERGIGRVGRGAGRRRGRNLRAGRRWYRLKAKLLGLDRLAHYDRMAPVSDETRPYRYEEARDLVLDCYRSFSPELGTAADGFFTGSYIDAPPEPGKRGGAFCAAVVPSVHPYLMLNFTSRMNDVLTMAHEMGHGVHYVLAADQGIFHFLDAADRRRNRFDIR